MSSEYVLPTKIFLMELRKKLRLVDFSKRILEKKRDSLQSVIRKTMDEVKGVLDFLEKELIELIRYIISTSFVYGEAIRTYALAQTEKISIRVEFRSEKGIMIPYFEVVRIPEVSNRFPEGIRAMAKRLISSLSDIMKLVAIFLKIELLLRELEVTNRIVNTLDRVLIPKLKEKIAYVTSMLSEFFISELSSLRVLISSMEEG